MMHWAAHMRVTVCLLAILGMSTASCQKDKGAEGLPHIFLNVVEPGGGPIPAKSIAVYLCADEFGQLAITEGTKLTQLVERRIARKKLAEVRGKLDALPKTTPRGEDATYYFSVLGASPGARSGSGVHSSNRKWQELWDTSLALFPNPKPFVSKGLYVRARLPLEPQKGLIDSKTLRDFTAADQKNAPSVYRALLHPGRLVHVPAGQERFSAAPSDDPSKRRFHRLDGLTLWLEGFETAP